MSCPSEPCHRAKSVQLVWSSRTGRCGDTWNTSKSVRTAGAHSRTMQEQISEACVESKAHHCIPSIVPALGLGNLCFWRPCQHVNIMSTFQSHHVAVSIGFNRFRRLLHFATGICLVAQLQQLRSRLTSILMA